MEKFLLSAQVQAGGNLANLPNSSGGSRTGEEDGGVGERTGGGGEDGGRGRRRRGNDKQPRSLNSYFPFPGAELAGLTYLVYPSRYVDKRKADAHRISVSCC
jgi:hypothetical protein